MASSLLLLIPALLLTLWTSPCCYGRPPQGAAANPQIDEQAEEEPSLSRAGENVPHRDYEIPEESIIELPFGRFPEPQCDYSVRAGGADGPAVSSAKIGDLLYHAWRCDTPEANSRMFCILVNNCTVSTQGSVRTIRHSIIDENGCTLEPQILPDVTYENDLEGGILCNAFSLGVDQPTISFNCGIKLLLKDDSGLCHRPKCSGNVGGNGRPTTPSTRFSDQ